VDTESATENIQPPLLAVLPLLAFARKQGDEARKQGGKGEKVR